MAISDVRQLGTVTRDWTARNGVNSTNLQNNRVSLFQGNMSVNESGDTVEFSTTRAPEEILEEIAQLQGQLEANNASIAELDAQIQDLIKQAEEKVDEAIKNREEITKAHEEEVKNTVNEELKKYVEANKTGDGMTKEELNENIKKAMPKFQGLEGALAALTEADGIVSQIDSSIGEMKTLINDNQEIEAQIADAQAEYEAALASAQSSDGGYSSGNGCGDSSGGSSSDDPIGFAYDGEMYDFIVDDGAFDSNSDFLGAKDQWAAMKALDTDGNGTVDNNELKAGKIKVVNSKGETGDISKLFGNDFSVDLKSYEANSHNNVSYEGIDTTLDDDGDGIVNQKLLGTFNVNIKGQTVKGYNTLDDSDFLSKKYGISKTEQASKNKINDLNGGLQDKMSNATNYEAESARLKLKIEEEYKNFDLIDKQIKSEGETVAAETSINAANFFNTPPQNDENQENKNDKDNPFLNLFKF